MAGSFYDFRDPKAIQGFGDSTRWFRSTMPIPPSWHAGKTLNWFHTDSEDNFKRNGNSSYRADSVDYRFNSQGFRGEDFDLTRSDEFRILFVGDSNTFGVGNRLSDIWPTLVCEELSGEEPVRGFNLGWGGTGSDWIGMVAHQSIDLIEPDLICVLYSMIGRRNWYADATVLFPFIPNLKNMGYNQMYQREFDAMVRLSNPYDSFFRFVQNHSLVQNCAGSIPLIWSTLEPIPVEFLSRYVDVRGHCGPMPDLAERARDNVHAGPPAHRAFAGQVIEQYGRIQ